MNAKQCFDIHGCDLSNLVRVADTFKCGVIRLWNWDEMKPGATGAKARYIAVNIEIPNLPLALHYYCGSVGDRDEWLKEANAWVDRCTGQGTNEEPSGWTVDRLFSTT